MVLGDCNDPTLVRLGAQDHVLDAGGLESFLNDGQVLCENRFRVEESDWVRNPGELRVTHKRGAR
jgi:hypothetical protein